jgi:hypothetical protein
MLLNRNSSMSVGIGPGWPAISDIGGWAYLDHGLQDFPEDLLGLFSTDPTCLSEHLLSDQLRTHWKQ